MKYPIEITETPHRGKPKTWTLYDEKHLFDVISFEKKRGCDAQNLDDFLDWLRSDLSYLNLTEKENRL